MICLDISFSVINFFFSFSFAPLRRRVRLSFFSRNAATPLRN